MSLCIGIDCALLKQSIPPSSLTRLITDVVSLPSPLGGTILFKILVKKKQMFLVINVARNNYKLMMDGPLRQLIANI